MDIQNLKAFIEVAQLESFSLAAEKLHLTQPAISKRIQALEEQLNARLFDRIRRGLILTETGECLLPRAKEILRLINSSRQALEDLSGEVTGELSLVTSHHIGLHRLPKLLQNYKKHYPQVKLNIQFKNSAEIYQDILSGHSAIGITTEESVNDLEIQKNILSRKLWQDKLVFVVARHHPLLKKGNLSLEDIAKYPAILPDKKFHTSEIVNELFARKGLKIKHEEGLRNNFLETIKALVSIGETWSVLPETMLDTKAVMPLKPKNIKLVRQLVCISHKERSLNNASHAFLQSINTSICRP